MNTLTITIQPNTKQRKARIEFDANRFEQFASNLGLFNKEFIESIERSESEIKQHKIKKLHSLKNIRRS